MPQPNVFQRMHQEWVAREDTVRMLRLVEGEILSEAPDRQRTDANREAGYYDGLRRAIAVLNGATVPKSKAALAPPSYTDPDQESKKP